LSLESCVCTLHSVHDTSRHRSQYLYAHDAANIKASLHAGGHLYNRIIFNIPHTRFPLTQSECNQATIASHRALVAAFLISAKGVVKPCGAVQITQRRLVHMAVGTFRNSETTLPTARLHLGSSVAVNFSLCFHST
jgi:hypothetical protein